MGFEEMAAYPNNIVQTPRPKARLPLEESEISLKNNVISEGGIITETNVNTQPIEISFDQRDTEVDNNPLETETYEMFLNKNTKPDFIKRKNARRIFASQRAAIVIDEIHVEPIELPNFQVEPLTFDRNTTVDFSVTDEIKNFTKSPENALQKEILTEERNNVRGKLSKDENRLELVDDDALLSKIKNDLDSLNNKVGGKKKATHPYLKKNAGINRRHHYNA